MINWIYCKDFNPACCQWFQRSVLFCLHVNLLISPSIQIVCPCSFLICSYWCKPSHMPIVWTTSSSLRRFLILTDCNAESIKQKKYRPSLNLLTIWVFRNQNLHVHAALNQVVQALRARAYFPKVHYGSFLPRSVYVLLISSSQSCAISGPQWLHQSIARRRRATRKACLTP